MQHRRRPQTGNSESQSYVERYGKARNPIRQKVRLKQEPVEPWRSSPNPPARLLHAWGFSFFRWLRVFPLEFLHQSKCLSSRSGLVFLSPCPVGVIENDPGPALTVNADERAFNCLKFFCGEVLQRGGDLLDFAHGMILTHFIPAFPPESLPVSISPAAISQSWRAPCASRSSARHEASGSTEHFRLRDLRVG